LLVYVLLDGHRVPHDVTHRVRHRALRTFLRQLLRHAARRSFARLDSWFNTTYWLLRFKLRDAKTSLYGWTTWTLHHQVPTAVCCGLNANSSINTRLPAFTSRTTAVSLLVGLCYHARTSDTGRAHTAHRLNGLLPQRAHALSCLVLDAHADVCTPSPLQRPLATHERPRSFVCASVIRARQTYLPRITPRLVCAPSPRFVLGLPHFLRAPRRLERVFPPSCWPSTFAFCLRLPRFQLPLCSTFPTSHRW